MKRLGPSLVEDIVLEKSANGLGFSISGGLYTEHLKNDHGIFVTKIIPGGSADMDGKLQVGDRLISVNDFSLEYVTHDDAVAAIASLVEQYNEIILRVGKVTNYAGLTGQSNQAALATMNKLVYLSLRHITNTKKVTYLSIERLSSIRKRFIFL